MNNQAIAKRSTKCSTKRSTKRSTKGVFLALISGAGFSTLGIFTKFAYKSGLSPVQALAWRFLFASIILWFMCIPKNRWRKEKKDYKAAFGLGVLGFAPQAGLFFLTLRYLSASLTALLLYLYPAFIIILSIVFLNRKPGLFQLGAALLSGLGCILTLWSKGDYPLIGYILGIIVAFAYAVYLLATERIIKDIDSLFATTVLLSSAAIVYWLIMLFIDGFAIPGSLTALAAISGMAVFGTLVPIVCLFYAIQLIGSADASLLSTVEPLFTVIIASLLLNERLGYLQLFGGVFIVLAVVMVNRGTKSAVMEEEQ